MRPKRESLQDKNKKKSPTIQNNAQTSSKVASKTPSTAVKQSNLQPVSKDQQQRLLNIFSASFARLFKTNFKAAIQAVKGHLYDRDFASAFGKQEFLEAYAARWSPSRALAYQDLLCSLLSEFLEPHVLRDGNSYRSFEGRDGDIRFEEDDLLASSSPYGLKAVCIGGGAGAELLAFAGAVSHILERQHWLEAPSPSPASESQPSERKEAVDDVDKVYMRLSLRLVDIADWSYVTETLLDCITTPPASSKYASAAIKASTASLLRQEEVDVVFEHTDILDASTERLTSCVSGCSIVTILFTLNELYSTSLSKSTKFLMSLTDLLSINTLLLVVDSPGSYSTVKIGKGDDKLEKKYPMHWLLDHTLLESAKREDGQVMWEKLQEDESRWFRLNKNLEYPIHLEDMRYQVHLYRRI